jgi:hypothetical protein
LLTLFFWQGGFHKNNSKNGKATVSLETIEQGILKGNNIDLLFWNQLYDNRQYLFLLAKQTNPNQTNRRSMVE